MFKLTCLLCGSEVFQGLVPMQEHVMAEHEYTVADLKGMTVEPLRTDPGFMQAKEYTYTMPDGKAWLKAERVF